VDWQVLPLPFQDCFWKEKKLVDGLRSVWNGLWLIPFDSRLQNSNRIGTLTKIGKWGLAPQNILLFCPAF